MKFDRLIEQILEAAPAPQSELSDFAQEFKWYQDKGLFRKDIDIKKKLAEGRIVLSKPGSLDNVSNCYTKLINGRDENERFKQFVDLYLKEDRGEMVRADTRESKIEYLRDLINTVKTNKNINPPIVINVEGVGRVMVGGRTRSAAAKVAGVPINVKYVDIKPEEIENINAVKQTFKEISV